MLIVDKFFYKTAVSLINQRGLTIKYLADICGVRPETLSKMLRRKGGSDLDAESSRKIRDVIAPNMTIDELYQEATKLAALRIAAHSYQYDETRRQAESGPEHRNNRRAVTITKLVKIGDIQIGEGRRPVDDDAVTKLMESIEEIGLLNAITVSEDMTLVAGAHRLEAFKRMGRTEIDANILELDELRLRMAEIDENLVRNALHYIDESDQIAERKAIYEALHPETMQGVAGGLASVRAKSTTEPGSVVETPSFDRDTAQKLGVDPRTIRQNVQIAKNLTDESKEAAKLLNVTKKEAVALARMSGEEQKKAFDKLENGEIKDIRELAKPMRASKKQENKEKVDSETHSPPQKSRDKAIQRYVAELKDDSIERGYTAEMFYYEYDDYVRSLIRRLGQYTHEPYADLYDELPEENAETLIAHSETVLGAVRSIIKKLKEKKSL